MGSCHESILRQDALTVNQNRGFRGSLDSKPNWVLMNWDDPRIPAGQKWEASPESPLPLRRKRSVRETRPGPSAGPPLNEGALLAYMERLEIRLGTPGLDFFARRRIRGFLASAQVLLGMVHQPGIPEGVKATQLRKLREAGARLGDGL